MEQQVTGQDMGYAPDTQGGHEESGLKDAGKKVITPGILSTRKKFLQES